MASKYQSALDKLAEKRKARERENTSNKPTNTDSSNTYSSSRYSSAWDKIREKRTSESQETVVQAQNEIAKRNAAAERLSANDYPLLQPVTAPGLDYKTPSPIAQQNTQAVKEKASKPEITSKDRALNYAANNLSGDSLSEYLHKKFSDKLAEGTDEDASGELDAVINIAKRYAKDGNREYNLEDFQKAANFYEAEMSRKYADFKRLNTPTRTQEEIQADLDKAKKETGVFEGLWSELKAFGTNLFAEKDSETGELKDSGSKEILDEYKRKEEKVAELERELAERKAYDKGLEYDSKYAGLANNADFEENSAYKNTANGNYYFNPLGETFTSGFDWNVYDAINGNPDAQKELRLERSLSGDQFSLTGLYDYEEYQMRDDERAIFNYLYKTEGRESAREFLNFIQDELYQRERVQKETEAKEYAAAHPVLSSLGTIAMSPLKGLAYVGQGLDLLDDGEINPNKSYNQLVYAPATIRSTVKKDMSWLGSEAYDQVMSMGDTVMSMAVGGGSSLSTLFMAGGIAAESTLDALDRGVSSGRAFLLGTADGAISYFTEKASLDNLFEGWSKKGIKKYILSQMATEGLEEGVEEIASTMADIFISQDKSHWSQAVKNYKRQGYSEGEAIGKALLDKGGDLLRSVVGGAISGGIFSGAGAIGGRTFDSIKYITNSDYKNVVDNIVSFVQITGTDLNAKDADAQTRINNTLKVIEEDVKKYTDILGSTEESYANKQIAAEALTNLVTIRDGIIKNNDMIARQIVKQDKKNQAAAKQAKKDIAKATEANKNIDKDSASEVDSKLNNESASTNAENRPEAAQSVNEQEPAEAANEAINNTTESVDGAARTDSRSFNDNKSYNVYEDLEIDNISTPADAANVIVRRAGGVNAAVDEIHALRDQYLKDNSAESKAALNTLREIDAEIRNNNITRRRAYADELKKTLARYGITNVVIEDADSSGFFNKETLGNGWHDSADGSIHLSPYLTTREAMYAVAAHELVHAAARGDASLVSDIARVRKELTEKGIFSFASEEKYREAYADKIKDMSEEDAKRYIEEEMAGDFLLLLERNTGDIVGYLAKNERSLLQKIIDFFANLFNKDGTPNRAAQMLAKDLRAALNASSALESAGVKVDTKIDKAVGNGSDSQRNSKDVDDNITKADIDILREIPRKSINQFTTEDIKKTEKWARKFYKELGVKSPFFRAWFGDWRANDSSKVKIVSVPTIDISQASLAKGNYLIEDTGWKVYAGKTLNDDTRHHSGGNRVNVKSLNAIEEILKNAVLFDSIVSSPDTNKKSSNTAFLHKLYTIIQYGENTYIAKVTIEEYYNETINSVSQRAYNLKAIKIEPAGGQLGINSSSSIPDARSTISIADLFGLVKQYDEEFKPIESSKVINDDGKPRVVYHWTNSDFTEFDPSRSGSNQGKTHGDGIYLSTSSDEFSYAGKNQMMLYAEIKNPFEMEMTEEEAERVYEKYAAPFHVDKFGLYKPHAMNALMSRYKVFDYLDEYASENKIKVSDILKELGYDGVHDGTEWVAYEPTQIKSATDNIGTFDKNNPDIRYSRDVSKFDADYMSAVERGDTETAQRMVDEAARENGFTPEHLFHGTSAFGFTKTDVANSDDGISFFVTNKEEVAQGYFPYYENEYDDYHDSVRRIGKKSERPRTPLSQTSSIEKVIKSIKNIDLDYKNARVATHADVLADLEKWWLPNAVSSARELQKYSLSSNVRELVDLVVNASADGSYEAWNAVADRYSEFADIYDIMYNGQYWHQATRLWHKVQMGIQMASKIMGKDAIVNNGKVESKAVLVNKYNDYLAGEANGIYDLYANHSNQLVIRGNGSNWNNIPLGNIASQFNEWWVNEKGHEPSENGGYTRSNTRDIAEFAKAKGYRSVCFVDIYDSGVYGSRGDLSTVYAFFNPHEDIKSADPVTYDDNGDVIPLSERFNPKNTDIRFSRDIETEAENTIRRQQERIDYLTKQLRAHTPFGWAKSVSPTARRNFAAEIASELPGISVDMVSNAVKSVWDVFEAAKKNASDTAESRVAKAAEKAREVAKELVENAVQTEVNPLYEQYNDLRVKLRTTPVKMNVSKAEFGGDADYRAWRSENKGLLRVSDSDSALPIDTYYQELSAQYPEFFPEDITDTADRLKRLGEVAVELKAIAGNKTEKVNPLEEVAESFTVDLANRILYGFDQLARVNPAAKHEYGALKNEQDVREAYASGTSDAAYREAEAYERGETAGKKRNEKEVQAALEREEIQRQIFERDFKKAQKNFNDGIERQNKRIYALERQIEQRSEKNRLTVARRSTLATLNRLNTMLMNPNRNKHVPQHLRAPVARLLASLGSTRLPNGKTVRASDMYAIDEAEYGRFEAESIRVADELKTVIDANKVSKDNAISNQFIDNLTRNIETLKQIYAEINPYSADDVVLPPNLADTRRINYIKQVGKILNMVEHYIKDSNVVFLNHKAVSAREASERLINDLKMRKGKIDDSSEASRLKEYLAGVGYEFLSADLAFQMIGESGVEIAQEYRRAQTMQANREQEFVDYMLKATDGKYSTHDAGFTGKLYPVTSNPNGPKATKSQIMQLYLTWKRPAGRRHLRNGGAIFTNELGQESKANTVQITQEIYNNLVSNLTEQDKLVADTIGKFLSRQCAEWGNEASMRMYGYRKFEDPSYFPLDVSKNALPSKWDSLDDFYKLENAGMTKSLKSNASSPLRMTDVFDIADYHVRTMAAYSAFAPVSNDVEKMMNMPGVAEAMNSGLGKKGVQYFETLMKSIASNKVRSGELADAAAPIQFLMNAYKRQAVAYNISTALKQPLSIVRALNEIEGKYVKEVPLVMSKAEYSRIYDTMLENSGVAKMKMLGFSDTGFGKSMRALYDKDYVNNAGVVRGALDKNKVGRSVVKAYDKFTDAGMWAAGKMDEVTWVRIWRACELEVADKYVGLSKTEAIKKTADRFNQIIGRTQVVDTILDTAPIMKNKAMAILTPFMNEPVKALASIITAADAVKNGKPNAGKKLRKAVGLVLLNNLVLEPIISTLMTMWKDEEDDTENIADFCKKFLKVYAGVNVDEGFSFAEFMSSNVVGGLFSFPIIQIFYETFSDSMNNYSNEKIDTAALTNLIKAAKNLITNVPKSKEDRNKSNYKLIAEFIGAAAAAFGVPANTLRKQTAAMYRSVLNVTDSYELQWEYNKVLYNLENGSARTQKGFYDILAAAYKEGDIEAFKMMLDDLTNVITDSPSAIEVDDIREAITDRGGEIEIGSDLWNVLTQARFYLPTYNSNMKVEKFLAVTYKDLEKASLSDSEIELDKIFLNAPSAPSYETTNNDGKQTTKPKKYDYTIETTSKKTESGKTITTETYEMSATGYEQYIADVGLLSYQVLREVCSSANLKKWNNLTEYQKQWAIQKIYDYSKRKYTKEFNTEYNISSGGSWMEVLYRKNAGQVDIADRILREAKSYDPKK